MLLLIVGLISLLAAMPFVIVAIIFAMAETWEKISPSQPDELPSNL